MKGYPLRFRLASDEWVSRLIDAARLISDRPVFAECSSDEILGFLHGKIAAKSGALRRDGLATRLRRRGTAEGRYIPPQWG